MRTKGGRRQLPHKGSHKGFLRGAVESYARCRLIGTVHPRKVECTTVHCIGRAWFADEFVKDWELRKLLCVSLGIQVVAATCINHG